MDNLVLGEADVRSAIEMYLRAEFNLVVIGELEVTVTASTSGSGNRITVSMRTEPAKPAKVDGPKVPS